MLPETQGYIDSLKNQWDQARDAVKGLPSQALNWKPLPQDTNSPAVLVSHMCGSTCLLIGQKLAGVDLASQRQADFSATARSTSELLAQIDKAEAQCKQALESATASSLEQPFALPGRDPMPSRAWVQRAIGHLGNHVGHLQLTCQLCATQKK
ncbi:MAG: DinB family protein [Chloroflexi bacterium]|nr:DinB family protein [Chloroflexota bacterium]